MDTDTFVSKVIETYIERLIAKGQLAIPEGAMYKGYGGVPGPDAFNTDKPVTVSWIAGKIYHGLHMNDVSCHKHVAMDHDWGDGTMGKYDNRYDWTVY